MKIYLGKISEQNGVQLEQNFYAGGDNTSTWYNNMQIGDYVFPIYKGKISKLWKVKAFGKTPITSNKFSDKSVLFEVVKTFDNEISLSTQLCMYSYFDLNLNILNKSSKSTSKEAKGFFEITQLPNCPMPNDIDFKDTRKIVVALENINYSFNDNDIRIKIDNDTSILDIEIYVKGKFIRYNTLWGLYSEKNITKYSLKDLYRFSIEDEAPRKEKYLASVISDIEDQGYFVVSQPIALYDNIIVGRKKNRAKKEIETKQSDDEIIEDVDTQRFEDYSAYIDLLNFNPNIILYGPPGTGKTYTAQRIVEANEYKLTNNPNISFEKIKKENRVEFITFHQSYGYEEFVEGIRPLIINPEEQEESSSEQGIKYEIKPGVLRNIANNASLDQLKSSESSLLKGIKKESKIYKFSLGERGAEETVYKDCKKNNIIAIGWLDNIDLTGKDYDFIYNELIKTKEDGAPAPNNDTNSINVFVNILQKGDVIFIYDGPYTIRDIGIIESDYIYDNSRKYFKHTRKIKWIKEFGETPADISSYNANVRLTMKTIYPLNRINFEDLVSIVGKETITTEEKKQAKPFYIIIDEINRGNISKIFGELITLIEKDKRDTLKITLPYSQKPFSLPSNLYIIGTMNTADRSIALLDTALRRRFVFKELEPKPEIIEEVGNNPIIENEVKLSSLLKYINENIEKEYDRDHRIGHSYFLEATNVKDLRHIWYFQIIPLLLEYFYNDGDKVAKIIGDQFINKTTCAVNYINSNKDFILELKKIYE